MALPGHVIGPNRPKGPTWDNRWAGLSESGRDSGEGKRSGGLPMTIWNILDPPGTGKKLSKKFEKSHFFDPQIWPYPALS